MMELYQAPFPNVLFCSNSYIPIIQVCYLIMVLSFNQIDMLQTVNFDGCLSWWQQQNSDNSFCDALLSQRWNNEWWLGSTQLLEGVVERHSLDAIGEISKTEPAPVASSSSFTVSPPVNNPPEQENHAPWLNNRAHQQNLEAEAVWKLPEAWANRRGEARKRCS